MRAKELLSLIPIPSRVIKYTYSRLTLTRFTVIYFVVAFLHAVIQGGFQLGSNSSNARADKTLSELLRVAAVEPSLIPIITPNDNGDDVLQLCNGIPSSPNDGRCQTVFSPTPTATASLTSETANIVPESNNDPSLDPLNTPFAAFPVDPNLALTVPAPAAAFSIATIDENAQPTEEASSIDVQASTALVVATSTAVVLTTQAQVSFQTVQVSQTILTTQTAIASTTSIILETSSIVQQTTSEVDTFTATQVTEIQTTVAQDTATEVASSTLDQATNIVDTSQALPPELTATQIVDTATAIASDTQAADIAEASRASASLEAAASAAAASQSAAAASASAAAEASAASLASLASLSAASASSEAAAASQASVASEQAAASASAAAEASAASVASEAAAASSASLASLASESAAAAAAAQNQATAVDQAASVADVGAPIRVVQTADPALQSKQADQNTGAIAAQANSGQDAIGNADPAQNNQQADDTRTAAAAQSAEAITSAPAAVAQEANIDAAQQTAPPAAASTPAADQAAKSVPEAQATTAPQVPDAQNAPAQDANAAQNPPADTAQQNQQADNAQANQQQQVDAAQPDQAARVRVRSAKFNSFADFKHLDKRKFSATPVMDQTTGKITGINVIDLANNGSTASTMVSIQCAQALTFAEENVHTARTEDLVLAGYYAWIFGVSTAAVLNESIPHLIAAFLLSILALVYNGLQLGRTQAFYKQFKFFITEGACNGLEIIPGYWTSRSQIEIPSLVLNCLTTLVLGGLSFRLYGVYQREADRLAEGSSIMKRLYKTVLTLSVVVQMSAFLFIASSALWLAQLFQSPIAKFSSTTKVFQAIGILLVLTAIPWFVTGWIAIRHEKRILMIVFLVINAIYLAYWISVFSSDVYRFLFTKWTFFSAMTVSTFFFLTISLIVGIIYRLHFGQGLAIQLKESKQADEPTVIPWDYSDSTEKAWEPFDILSNRGSSVGRHSAFDYGTGSPQQAPAQLKPVSMMSFGSLMPVNHRV